MSPCRCVPLQSFILALNSPGSPFFCSRARSLSCTFIFAFLHSCWPGGPPEHHTHITEGRRHEQDGWVLAIARTEAGERLLASASEGKGAVLSLVPAHADDVISTQPHQVTRAVGHWSRRLAHAVVGAQLPSLGPQLTHQMSRAALDKDAVAAATDTSGVTMGSESRPVDQGNNPTESSLGPGLGAVSPALQKGFGRLGELLGLSLENNPSDLAWLSEASLSEESVTHPLTVAFHDANFAGAAMRIQRGDNAEKAPAAAVTRSASL